MLIVNNDRSENGSISDYSNRMDLSGMISPIDHHHKLAASLERRAAGRKRALVRMLQSMPALMWELDRDFRLYGRIRNLESISTKRVR